MFRAHRNRIRANAGRIVGIRTRWMVLGLAAGFAAGVPSWAQTCTPIGSPAHATPAAPQWEIKRNAVVPGEFHAPTYPLAFVAAPIYEIVTPGPFCASDCTSTGIPGCQPQVAERRRNDYRIGTDVLSANDPEEGSALYIYLPANHTVVKLFPLAAHSPSKIDFSPDVGAVVEPNLSENGTTIYFSYYQDARSVVSTTEYGNNLPFSGADIYALDIGPLLTTPTTDPATLTVRRLTTRSYRSTNLSCQESRKQLVTERDGLAMNPPMATGTAHNDTDYGTSYLHPIELRTRYGLKLAYVSDKRRLDNSNIDMVRANHNFNLHIADINPDGTLGAIDNQFQYYTTTSTLSPAPLRNGMAISYQASTEDARNWHIQGMDSEGKWYPVIGYGSNPELFHLGSFCRGRDGAVVKDYFVATRYYNSNNEGFGTLWAQDLGVVGKNSYNSAVQNGLYLPSQSGSTMLTLGATSEDVPSAKNGGQYRGKFTSPRCGGIDELYFAYSPTSANSRLYDSECRRGHYRSYIGVRLPPTGVSFATPFTADAIGSAGHYRVVREIGGNYNLVWPVPIIPWSTRSGDSQQQTATASIIVNQTHIAPGEPFAQVGTSALYNTDRRPLECGFTQQSPSNAVWYNPWGTFAIGTENDKLTNNQDGWTVMPGQLPWSFCAASALPSQQSILGIAVNVTSNKTDLRSHAPGYKTAGLVKPQEAKKLLGVYDVRTQSDQSFRALIPAQTPFEFQLLDRNYGLKLTDVRSWHSLKVREKRTDCGGCHQHDVAQQAIPFDGTKYAATHAPADFVRGTPRVTYDVNCNPQISVTTVATTSYPEWRTDIFPGLVSYCSSCHVTGASGAAALDWGTPANEKSIYDQIVARQYASAKRGALGSQLFWAARGLRTDNRPNTAYPAKYQNTSLPDKDRFGFYFTSKHATSPISCANGSPGYAAWVLALGQWIDNHMPRDANSGESGYGNPGYKHDWYHPTADVAVINSGCTGQYLRVGWWDDTGAVKSIVVKLDSQVIYSNSVSAPPGLANNTATITLAAPASNSAVVTVEVIDLADNRQIYRKKIDQMRDECLLPVVSDPPPM